MKKLTLISLMLGLMLVTASGLVSAGGCVDPESPGVYECTGWDCLKTCEQWDEKDFFVTGRADTSNWDMAIWNGVPEQIEEQGEYPWVNHGEHVPFSVSYDPDTGLVTYTISQTTLTWTYDSDKAFEYLVIMAKGNDGGDMTLSDVEVNGANVGNVISVSNYKGIKVYLTDAQQANGFVVTGDAEMDWDSKTTQEIPGLHVFAMNTHDLELSECELIIDNPIEDQEWYDSEAVNITWYLEGETCTPIDRFDVWYEKNGNCALDGSWLNVPGAQNLAPGDVESPAFPDYSFLWDKPLESGVYCVKVKVSSNGARDVSEEFYVDLAPPEVSLSVGSPKVGDCNDEVGDCYVNQNTLVTLTCLDNNPDEVWQSGVDYIEYRYQINGGNWTDWIEDNSFSFPEDSNHLLQYRCFDNVGKVDSEEKSFIVDSQAPIIESKVVEGLKYGTCPPLEENDECWITSGTNIIVTAVDPAPHPVGNVSCEWGYELDGQNYGSGYNCNGPICTINFSQETEHLLYVTCQDGLGNSQTIDEETFYVDNSKPETIKWYEGPQYPERHEGWDVVWINGVTTINLEAQDYPDNEVCKVGIDKTQYRVSGALADSFCEPANCENWMSLFRPDMGEWQEYEGPFGIDEESCHVIEYRSIDLLGHEENIQWQCVFVDHTAPKPIKDVGKPAHECVEFWEQFTGECEESWDWIVTMETPITISCEDQGPHPSGIDGLCYRIELDGDAVFDNGHENGYQCDGDLIESNNETWCCIEREEIPIYFYEPSEHLLEFYCVDNVNKTSKIDSELFKVDGTAFTIEILKKWNLISIPFQLISSDINETFFPIKDKIEAVWSYDETGWHVYSPEGPSDLSTIEPGYGYWVKASEDTSLIVGGSLFGPAPGIPPSRGLQQGWNLIGHYGTDSKEAYCSLFSLIDTTIGYPRWSSLVGYDSENMEFEYLDAGDDTNPGRGYWIEMDVEDNYSPATTCWGFP